ncbi:UrcA family protein [Erythrobacter sp. GH1-10]|uniref:UrcA family protein n=1 Tax=Erythrobacter sp. GH1-10 TaxID=3349334 RepID=UPI0038780E07
MTNPVHTLAISRLIALTLPLILALGAIPGPARAAPNESRVAVDYSDLDLTEEAGRATLDRRLKQAVRRVCDAGQTRSVRVATETRQCIAEKRAEVEEVRSAVIARAHAKRSKQGLAHSQR